MGCVQPANCEAWGLLGDSLRARSSSARRRNTSRASQERTPLLSRSRLGPRRRRRRRLAIGADGDQLKAVVSRFERPHRCGVDANDIPAAELPDLVVESDLSGAADDDVGLLLFTVPPKVSGRRGYTADRRSQDARSRGACARTAPRSRARARPWSPRPHLSGSRSNTRSSVLLSSGQCSVPTGKRYAGAPPSLGASGGL